MVGEIEKQFSLTPEAFSPRGRQETSFYQFMQTPRNLSQSWTAEHRFLQSPNRPKRFLALLATLLLAAASATKAQSPMPDDFNPAANGPVRSIAVQAGGKILVGGNFTTLGGQPRNSLGRLNADGTLDNTFTLGVSGASPDVTCFAVQADGKILIGGYFTKLGGQAHKYIGRVNADGTLDNNFDPGAQSAINSVAVQADGKIIVGGLFTTLGGQPRNYVGRLNADGTLDNTFSPGVGGVTFPNVRALAAQADGKILIGGGFTTLGGEPRNYVGRLNADGTLDNTFSPGANDYVKSIAVQADGKILVSGSFTMLAGQPRNYIGRLNTDGTLDDVFNPGPNSEVDSLAVQADGKILVGGRFTNLAGQARNRIGRLNADGTLDTSFNPGAGDNVHSLAVQPDGMIVVGGGFTNLAGQTRNYIGRLNNTGPATHTLTCDGATIIWLRGGTSPEAWRTTFDVSTNGSDWTFLGAGSRIDGGWHLTGVSVPPLAMIRARAYIAGGGAADWIVETYSGRPVLTRQPASSTNNALATASFSVVGGGSEPLGYYWLKDSTPLLDGGNLTGVFTPTLVVSNVLKGEEGFYQVVVSNAFGSVTSQVATLTVVDPVLIGSPASRYAEVGQTVALSVNAAGSTLSYLWLKDGAALPYGTVASLTITNVQLSDAGDYRAVVSNPFGSVTSAVATLTVNLSKLDTNFNPVANGSVSAVALQTDGRILIGGTFTTLTGQTRTRLGRLNTNGSVDTGFFNASANAAVYSLAVQADGKVLVGGDFTSLAGYTRNFLGRLNTNGTLDTSFNPTLTTPPPYYTMTGRAQAIVVQPDGKIVVGGRYQFTPPVGPVWPTMGFVLRLNTNGTSDGGFTTTGGVNGPVTSLALQPDGKILAGGLFTTLRGLTQTRLGRLNSDGTLDTNFDASADNTVLTLAVQPDNKILVGGSFTSVAGQPRTHLARLKPNGTADTDFAPDVRGGGAASVCSFALQTDGRLLVSGLFTNVAGQARANLARLNADGTLDSGFIPSPNNYVYGLAIQVDGKAVAVGDFTQFGGQSRSRIARLDPTEPATQSLSYDGTTLVWQRGGSSPEVWRASFEFSTNLTSWSSLGAGTRAAGGWELAGLGLSSGRIRARGAVAGGGFNASAWFVEQTLNISVAAAPQILTSDGNFGFRTNRFGFNLSAASGQAVIVEASTNLVTWIPIHTNLMGGSGLFLFHDLESSLFPRRFYRARLHVGALPAPGIQDSAGLTRSRSFITPW